MNYPPNQGNPEYQGGYQQQPPQQPYYPPAQAGYPPPQPMPPQYQQPYPQQMMYPPQQTNVNVNVGYQRPQQINMLIRMIYFVCIGWWLGLFWLSIALGFCVSIIGLPIGLMMLNRLGAVMTLSSR